MDSSLLKKIRARFVKWLLEEVEPLRSLPLSDFGRLQHELKPCDVILVEGRSRISEVIRIITQSSWSHAALYIGRIHDIENKDAREHILKFYQCQPEEQLVIESMLGQGIIVTPLTRYRLEHLRICRPHGIYFKDAQEVIDYAISRLGLLYGVREIIDLARFLFPWTIVPRRWHSSLFSYSNDDTVRESCSSLIAEAFQHVDFPILPTIKHNKGTTDELIQRNPRLFTPSDFDYSPFFEIIKYPIFELSGASNYRKLPWNRDGVLSNDQGKLFIPSLQKKPVPNADIGTKTEDEKKTPPMPLDFYD